MLPALRSPRRRAVLLVWIAVAGLGSPAMAQADDLVALHLKIEDELSGLQLQAVKRVEAGVDAFTALQQIVSLEVKKYGRDVFVTGICGVTPPRSHYWALYVDGEYAERGIRAIKLDRDTRLEWRTKKR